MADTVRTYYLEHYGEKDTDIWYEQPAAKVWVFAREEKLVTLQCHILTGTVSASEE